MFKIKPVRLLNNNTTMYVTVFQVIGNLALSQWQMDFHEACARLVQVTHSVCGFFEMKRLQHYNTELCLNRKYTEFAFCTLDSWLHFFFWKRYLTSVELHIFTQGDRGVRYCSISGFNILTKKELSALRPRCLGFLKMLLSWFNC